MIYTSCIIINGNQNFTRSIQFNCKIATIEAILMFFAAFERRESLLLIDTKIVKFGGIDGKLNENWNDILDVMIQEGRKIK